MNRIRYQVDTYQPAPTRLLNMRNYHETDKWINAYRHVRHPGLTFFPHVHDDVRHFISPSTQPLNLDFPLLENGITIYLIAQVRNLAIILNYHPTLSYLHTLHLVHLESNCIAYMIIGVKLSSLPSLPAGII